MRTAATGLAPQGSAVEFNEDCTLVTALFNLRRDTWKPPYHRAWAYYLHHFRKTLSLRCNMVVFVEHETVDFVERVRRKCDAALRHTRIKIITAEDLPLARLHDRIASVLSDSSLRKGLQRTLRPETYVPSYCVVILSKTGLVRRVCAENPLGSLYFMWIDAGLCREKFPNRLRYAYYPNKTKLGLLDDGKVHILCRSMPQESDACIERFFRSGSNRMAGGWFGGAAQPLIEFDERCTGIVEEALAKGVIDSEQSVFAVCYLRHPKLFALHFGDWYDGFLSF